jgi:8-oxo-dGTP pyrophosphatase MutT (NUDIX family)
VIREFSAGGVVVRRFRGRPFVAVVRVRDDVLALPKGHPDEDESALEAARREVREETGLVADPVEKLGDIRYWYWREGGRVLKIVSFFLFRWRSGSVRDHDREVEEAAWIPLEEAPTRLAYSGEREMAAAALSRLAPGR